MKRHIVLVLFALLSLSTIGLFASQKTAKANTSDEVAHLKRQVASLRIEGKDFRERLAPRREFGGVYYPFLFYRDGKQRFLKPGLTGSIIEEPDEAEWAIIDIIPSKPMCNRSK